MRSYIYKLLVISLIQLCVEAEFCFRKLHSSHPDESGLSVCRGLYHTEFADAEECCETRGAIGYSAELVTLGRRKMKYRCIPCNQEDDTKNDLIIKDGSGWSVWGDWSRCSVSCAAGTRARQRLCQAESCNGENREVEPCFDMLDCPVDGSWGPWDPWSQCSRTCNGGEMRRERSCNDPPPMHNGQECPGESVEMNTCNTNPCPVDGVWSDWYTEGGCSKTCDRGVMVRKRACDNPRPDHGGSYCIGRDTINEKCNLGQCPWDGMWSLWTRWTACDVTCGQGERVRARECNAPPPRYGGKYCEGQETEIQQCHSLLPCPVNGGWSVWGMWGPCFANPCTGAKGVQKRTRTCTNPQPKYRGTLCEGEHTEIQECFNNHGCPVKGEWCEWEEYTECRYSDSGPFRLRLRECSCPLPENGGTHCRDDDFQVEACRIDTTGMIPSGCGGRGLPEGSGWLDDDDC